MATWQGKVNLPTGPELFKVEADNVNVATAMLSAYGPLMESPTPTIGGVAGNVSAGKFLWVMLVVNIAGLILFVSLLGSM